MVSHHIPRTEICRIFLSGRRELLKMIEEDRAASRPLCQSPVNVIVIPLINMVKTINHCCPASWTESGNGQRGSNVMILYYKQIVYVIDIQGRI